MFGLLLVPACLIGESGLPGVAVLTVALAAMSMCVVSSTAVLAVVAAAVGAALLFSLVAWIF